MRRVEIPIGRDAQSRKHRSRLRNEGQQSGLEDRQRCTQIMIAQGYWRCQSAGAASPYVRSGWRAHQRGEGTLRLRNLHLCKCRSGVLSFLKGTLCLLIRRNHGGQSAGRRTDRQKRDDAANKHRHHDQPDERKRNKHRTGSFHAAFPFRFVAVPIRFLIDPVAHCAPPHLIRTAYILPRK